MPRIFFPSSDFLIILKVCFHIVSTLPIGCTFVGRCFNIPLNISYGFFYIVIIIIICYSEFEYCLCCRNTNLFPDGNSWAIDIQRHFTKCCNFKIKRQRSNLVFFFQQFSFTFTFSWIFKSNFEEFGLAMFQSVL